MKSPAPIELLQMGLDPSKFTYSDRKSFRGPCPKCGGTRRFVVFVDNPWPLFNGYCDECATTIKAWERVKTHYDPVQAMKLKSAQEAEERAREEYRKTKLAEFTTHEIWQELSERLTMEHIDWWTENGVPESILKYSRIGYTPDKFYYEGKGDEKIERHSPAYTIPWFGEGFVFETMQYRLLTPSNPKDRYRFEDSLGGGGRYFYRVDPAEKIGDKVIICEGVKKALVTWLWLAPELEHFTILAASSANTLAPALEATKDCSLRYVVLDPDAKRWTELVKNANIVDLPFKIDDGWKDYGFSRTDFENALKQSRKV